MRYWPMSYWPMRGYRCMGAALAEMNVIIRGLNRRALPALYRAGQVERNREHKKRRRERPFTTAQRAPVIARREL